MFVIVIHLFKLQNYKNSASLARNGMIILVKIRIICSRDKRVSLIVLFMILTFDYFDILVETEDGASEQK